MTGQMVVLASGRLHIRLNMVPLKQNLIWNMSRGQRYGCGCHVAIFITRYFYGMQLGVNYPRKQLLAVMESETQCNLGTPENPGNLEARGIKHAYLVEDLEVEVIYEPLIPEQQTCSSTQVCATVDVWDKLPGHSQLFGCLSKISMKFNGRDAIALVNLDGVSVLIVKL